MQAAGQPGSRAAGQPGTAKQTTGRRVGLQSGQEERQPIKLDSQRAEWPKSLWIRENQLG